MKIASMSGRAKKRRKSSATRLANNGFNHEGAWIYPLIKGLGETSMNTVFWFEDLATFSCIKLISNEVVLGVVLPVDITVPTCVSFFGNDVHLPVLTHTNYHIIIEGAISYPGNVVFTTNPRNDIGLIPIYPVRSYLCIGNTLLFFGKKSFSYTEIAYLEYPNPMWYELIPGSLAQTPAGPKTPESFDELISTVKKAFISDEATLFMKKYLTLTCI